MAQLTPYEQSLGNILHTVVSSLLPFHLSQLKRTAQRDYPANGNSLIGIQNVVIPRLYRIFSHAHDPNELFTQLYDVQDEGASLWFTTTEVPSQLVLDVDRLLFEIWEILTNIEDNMKQLERKLSYADFISDLFHVVSRDISGGALELRHRIPAPHQEQNAPPRKFFNFNQKSACKSAVMEASERIHGGNPLSVTDYLDVTGAIANLTITNTQIDDWLHELFQIYEDVARKYSFRNVTDMFHYLRIKQYRNADSHFNDWIKSFSPSQQNPLEEFVNTYMDLRREFEPNEMNLLEPTFEKCQTNLRAFPRLSTGYTITVTPNNSPQGAYNAYFMREMNPVNEYRIARPIVTINASNERRREPKYWDPQTIDTNHFKIKFDHRVPEGNYLP